MSSDYRQAPSHHGGGEHSRDGRNRLGNLSETAAQCLGYTTDVLENRLGQPFFRSHVLCLGKIASK